MNEILLIVLLVIYVWSIGLSVYSVSLRGIEPNITIFMLYFCPIINTLYTVWRLYKHLSKNKCDFKTTIKKLFE
jgi:hypothetical protein